MAKLNKIKELNGRLVVLKNISKNDNHKKLRKNKIFQPRKKLISKTMPSKLKKEVKRFKKLSKYYHFVMK